MAAKGPVSKMTPAKMEPTNDAEPEPAWKLPFCYINWKNCQFDFEISAELKRYLSNPSKLAFLPGILFVWARGAPRRSSRGHRSPCCRGRRLQGRKDWQGQVTEVNVTMIIITFGASPASKNNLVDLVIKSGSPRTTTQAHPPLSMPSSSTEMFSLLIMFSSSDSLLLPSPFSSLSVSEPIIGTVLSSTVISARLTVVERERHFLTILSLSLKQDLFASIECFGDLEKVWSTAFKRQTSSGIRCRTLNPLQQLQSLAFWVRPSYSNVYFLLKHGDIYR